MKIKAAFTLLEITITTILIFFMFILISKVLTSLENSYQKLSLNSNLNDKNLIYLLYYDIFNATEVRIIHISFNKDILLLHTHNSLYKIPFPYVKWFIRKGKLYRIENPHPRIKNLLDWKKIPIIFTIDKISNNKINIFKIYKKNKNYLIFINSIFFDFKNFNN